ncbi:glycosyltransferase [Dyella sp. ASV21]|uniref:glycosyltransferase n=1 Tax=Dyella sp. ASV21 TaxID=2795114 RepID=UPI0018EAEB0D
MLVIDSVVPDPTRDSGSVRACQILQLLHADGWEISFLAGDGYASAGDIARLAALGVRYVDGHPLRWLRKNGHRLDAALLCRVPIATQYLGLVRQYAPRATVVFDTVDLHHLRERRAALLTGNRRLGRHAEQSRRRELAAISRSDVTLVVSADEQATLARELPGSRVELLSNIHEVHGRRQGFHARRDLLFVGGFGHPPNADAMHWFATDILPLLLADDPSITLHLVGDIDEASRRLLNREGLKIHGRVDDLAPLLDGCRLSVAPLRFGAGVKGKVNLAMSYGLPVVVTSVAAEGMHLTDGVDALVADDAERFAASVMRLYRDPELWMRLSDAALANVSNHFSVDLARRSLRGIFSRGTPSTDEA